MYSSEISLNYYSSDQVVPPDRVATIADDRVGRDSTKMTGPASAPAPTEGTLQVSKEDGFEGFTPDNFNNLSPTRVSGLAETSANFTETGTGSAQRVVARYGHIMRHVRGVGWHVWNRKAWVHSEILAIGLAQRTAAAIGDELDHLSSDSEKARRMAHRNWSLGRSGLSSMLALARPALTIDAEALDADPMLLNAANGIVDLRTGRLVSHDRDRFITKMVPVEFDDAAPCPHWDKFLTDVFLDDPAVISAVQRLIGYSLTGLTTEQIMVICYGVGSNGKSTLAEIIAELLGDYGQKGSMETFMESDRSGGIPNDLARMRGARFVLASETRQGRPLAESKIKELTGDRKISARYMRAEFFEFTPEMKIWFTVNHKPRVIGTDEGIWRRIVLLPFKQKFVDAAHEDKSLPRKDPSMGEQLRKELPGILAWAVKGCLDWQKHGLALPDTMVAAAKKYRQDEDTLGAFLSLAVESKPNTRLSNAALYAAYVEWCFGNGEEPVKGKTFSILMRERGNEAVKVSTMQWQDLVFTAEGVGLRESANSRKAGAVMSRAIASEEDRASAD